MTTNYDEGYQDGLAGLNNARHSPEYCLGWEAGWRERMLVWNSVSIVQQPVGIDDVETAA